MMNNAINMMSLDNFTPATMDTFPRPVGEKAPEMEVELKALVAESEALQERIRVLKGKYHEQKEKEDNKFRERIETHNFLAAMAVSNLGKVISDNNRDGIRNILGYSNVKPIQDHHGMNFKTIADMCDNYGITYKAYDNRKRIGWNLERILTTPVRDYKKVPKKVKENNISPQTYKYRKSKGYPEEVCVLPPREFANWKRKKEVKEINKRANELITRWEKEKKAGVEMNIG